VAFADLIEPVVSAKTARFNMAFKLEGQPESKAKAYFASPGHFRQELFGTIVIADWSQDRMTTLIPATNQALVAEPKGANKRKMAGNFFAELQSGLRDARQDGSGKLEALRERKVEGRTLVGYRAHHGGWSMTVWGDEQTRLPLRVEMAIEPKGGPKLQITMTDFEFNVPLENSLFSLTPPEAYSVISAEINTGSPTESDFIQSLRKCAEMAGGSFPPGFDPASLGKTFAMVFAKSKGPSKADMQKRMQEMTNITWGLKFALELPPEANAHYAGRDAKLDTPDRPIFWYQPTGSDQYRVIHADLSVSLQKTAPDVPGAVRLTPATRPTANGK
jgi:outer membrane lipoprotein-sorting protein